MAEISVMLASQEIDINILLKAEASERATSFPHATETQPHTAQVVLSDPDGNFSPKNPSNFFASNGHNQNGARCPVEIRADRHILFAGEVDDLTHNTDSAIATLKCIDNTRSLRIEELTNFGIQKAWKLIQDTEASAENGIYPLGLGVTPLSEESVSAKKALNQDLTLVSEIQDAGVLDPDNIQVTETAVISEGGPIDAAASSAYPQITGKSPYRYKKVVTLINAILDHYAIATDRRYIEIPPQRTDLHAEPMGRPGYESVVGNIGSAQHLNWNGYVTDILKDRSTIYFAYTVNREQFAFSRIIVLDEATDTVGTLYTFDTSRREIWGLAKIGDNLVMLVTDARNTSASDTTPVDGSYDSSQPTNKTKLLYFDVTQSSPSVGTLVDSDATLPVQLATFYQIGSAIPNTTPNIKDQLLPDTRRRLIVEGSTLYYPYAKADGEFGVAQVAIGGTPSAVTVAQSDGYNHAGFAYARAGNKTIFGTTYITPDGRSTFKIFSK